MVPRVRSRWIVSRWTAFGFILLTACGQAAVGAPVAETRIVLQNIGFQTPESVLHDPDADVYLVSNINGNPAVTDDNGFVSRLSPSGTVAMLKWIDGASAAVTLHAPKGMAVVADTLYVTDITVVRMFDRKTGLPKGAIQIAGSNFLNDLVAGSDGTVYATDSGFKPDFSLSGTDAIYRIDPRGQVTPVAKSTELHHPNGIAILPGGQLLVVTFTAKGEVYMLGPDGTRRLLPALPGGQLDGVELLADGSYLVSSWGASAVFRATPDGSSKAVVENVKAPADIGYDRKRGRVLIPQFMDHRVVIQAVQ